MVTIEPPLCIIDIGNGCEAFSSTLYIPTKSELTTTMQSLTQSQFFLNYNFQYVKMSSFVVFHEMTFAQLTSEELANLQAKIQTLEPMNMKLFNEKLKLIDENYPLTLPPWLILGGQVISGAFILTEITLTVWFCLKHRKSMSTLLKIGLPLARQIQNDPKIIEHLVQQPGELVMNLVPPEPPPRPPVTTTECPAIVSKLSMNGNTIVTSSTSVDFSSSLPSRAHWHTLEFITEAAQELYAKGQLHIKPYAGYLKEKRKKVHSTESNI